jgi:hypothetical protein
MNNFGTILNKNRAGFARTSFAERKPLALFLISLAAIVAAFQRACFRELQFVRCNFLCHDAYMLSAGQTASTRYCGANTTRDLNG